MERRRKWNNYKIKILKKTRQAADFIKLISTAPPLLKTKTLQKNWFGVGRSRLEYEVEVFKISDNSKEALILQDSVMRFTLKLKA